MGDAKSRSANASFINPDGMIDPTHFHFSQVAVTAPGARTVFLAGQGGHAPGQPLSPDFAEQTRQIFRNITTGLSSVGAATEDIVRLTVYIVGYDAERMTAYHAAQVEVLGEHRPAATLIPVEKLGAPDMLIEIEATAVAPA